MTHKSDAKPLAIIAKALDVYADCIEILSSCDGSVSTTTATIADEMIQELHSLSNDELVMEIEQNLSTVALLLRFQSFTVSADVANHHKNKISNPHSSNMQRVRKRRKLNSEDKYPMNDEKLSSPKKKRKV